MVKICLSPVVSSRIEPCVAKYRLLRTDTGYGVELFFFCLSARRYDPLFRFWRGEARPGDHAAAEAILRAQLRLSAANGWRFIGKDGRIAAQKEGGSTG